MKKSIPALLAALSAVILLSGCNPSASPSVTPSDTPSGSTSPSASGGSKGMYQPGTYSAAAQGYGGEVKVTVTVDENNITEVSIDGPNETPDIGGKAIQTLPETIKKANSDQFDGVSGATVTSGAVKKAVGDALAQAKR